jgi:hypothetical protein
MDAGVFQPGADMGVSSVHPALFRNLANSLIQVK